MKAHVVPRLLSSLEWIDSGVVMSQHRLESFFIKWIVMDWQVSWNSCVVYTFKKHTFNRTIQVQLQFSRLFQNASSMYSVDKCICLILRQRHCNSQFYPRVHHCLNGKIWLFIFRWVIAVKFLLGVITNTASINHFTSSYLLLCLENKLFSWLVCNQTFGNESECSTDWCDHCHYLQPSDK